MKRTERFSRGRDEQPDEHRARHEQRGVDDGVLDRLERTPGRRPACGSCRSPPTGVSGVSRSDCWNDSCSDISTGSRPKMPIRMHRRADQGPPGGALRPGRRRRRGGFGGACPTSGSAVCSISSSSRRAISRPAPRRRPGRPCSARRVGSVLAEHDGTRSPARAPRRSSGYCSTRAAGPSRRCSGSRTNVAVPGTFLLSSSSTAWSSPTEARIGRSPVPSENALTCSGADSHLTKSIAACLLRVAVVEDHPVVRAGDRLVPAARAGEGRHHLHAVVDVGELAADPTDR